MALPNYGQGGAHDIHNGIVLTSDIHRLFDLGYVTVTPDYHFRVSDSLADEYQNGRDYYARQGSALDVPSAKELRPDRELLAWHRESVFRG
jgi:putative restriction endonuclease